MNSTDIWWRFCRSAMSSRICFWIVTSSAVVGSSAISSLGSQAIAIAIITRCCWPPESCDGNESMRRSGSGMPTSRSRSTARLRAARPDLPMCRRSTSSSCQPTVKTGFSDVIGSWKIIEMSAPRSLRSSPIGSASRLRPPYSTSLAGSMIEFSGGSSPSIASDVTDLPDPDSPTSATVLSRGMSNEMPFTASNVVWRSRRNEIRRLRTLTSGSPVNFVLLMRPSIDVDCSRTSAGSNAWMRSCSEPSLELRVERVAQRVGEQRERSDERGHRARRGDELPPFAEDQLVLCLVQHRAPRHDIDGNAEAEKRQDHFGLDERDDEDRQLHEHDVRDVRENVEEHPPAVGRADRIRGLHVLA